MPPHVEILLIEKLRFGTFRTANQFEQWLKDEHQLGYRKVCIYYVRGKLGGRLKVPRPCHQKKELKREEE